jgi:hypothetical protein
LTQGVTLGRHATIALAHLSSMADAAGKPLLSTYNVRGFVCDSAPINATAIKHVLSLEITNKKLPQLFKKLPCYRIPKAEILKTRAFKAIAFVLGNFVNLVRWTLMDKNGIDYNEQMGIITSKGKIEHILCPIFFIHPLHDDYMPSAGSQEVAKEACDKREWYSEKTCDHAKGSHSVYPHEYVHNLLPFIDYALNKPLATTPSPALPAVEDSRTLFNRDIPIRLYAAMLR